MNAIIALCHFCDHHGPTTLFCTQAFKYADYQQINSNKLDTSILLESVEPDIQSPNLSEQENQILAQSSPSNETVSSPSACKACRAFDRNFHHYISYDNSTSFPNSPNQICYLSQSNPIDSEIFALVRKACLRTLHCEVFEDPIYFDDDKNGSVIGYEFNIKDIEGRGVQRSYSLLIIMKDRIYLQHLWSFLSKQMSIIANNLKQEAERKYQKDLVERGLSPSSQSNTNQFFNFKKTSKQVRGLIDITGDQMIFAKLHMWFTWILRMSSCQIREVFMHGPLSEDYQVKCELEKLKELSNDVDQNDELIFNLNLNKDECLSNNNNNNTKMMFKIENDQDLNEFLCGHIRVESLKQFFKLVGIEKFRQIAYNIIIGNQVIIRGKYEKLVESIIRILEDLVPLGCCKSVYFSSKYLKSYECKLLGLNDKVTLFKNSTSSNEYAFDDLNEFILVDVKVDSSLRLDRTNINLTKENFNEQELKSLIDFKINFQVYTNVKEIVYVPSIQTKIEYYLLNEILDDASIASLIRVAKDEWINKTKVFYKFLQSPSVKSSTNSETVLQILNLNKNDEMALRYWQAGLSHECKTQIRAS